DDVEGAVIATSEARPTDGMIKHALARFVGEIAQIPPKYSAVKIDGARAYDRARDGQDFEIAPRPLWVEELTLVDRPDEDHAVLHMVCGKGGYVRSIARDLGEALGCYGHVKTLHRVWSGPFADSDALAYDDLERLAGSEALTAYLRPLENGLDALPRMICSETEAMRLRNGNPGAVSGEALEYGDECWAAHDDQAIAVGRYRAGLLHPTRVFVKTKHEDYAETPAGA
ncbi:MAG: tRNA pseudouridine(55) synthase TruB, partial [Pseudomonadota bacterium]